MPVPKAFKDAIDALTNVSHAEEATVEGKTVYKIYTDKDAAAIFAEAEAAGLTVPKGDPRFGVKHDDQGRYVEVLK